MCDIIYSLLLKCLYFEFQVFPELHKNTLESDRQTLVATGTWNSRRYFCPKYRVKKHLTEAAHVEILYPHDIRYCISLLQFDNDAISQHRFLVTTRYRIDSRSSVVTSWKNCGPKIKLLLISHIQLFSLHARKVRKISGDFVCLLYALLQINVISEREIYLIRPQRIKPSCHHPCTGRGIH